MPENTGSVDDGIRAEMSKVQKEQLEKQIKRIPQLSEDELKNRFSFHPANTEEKRNDHTSVRTHCLELALYLGEKVPEGREKALAITHLEEVMMWANAGIARSNT